MENIFAKAHELGQLLAESETFRALNDAKAAQEQDTDAQLILMNYNRRREEIVKKAGDPNITKEEMQELRNQMQAEVDKLNASPVIGKFMEAMQAFNSMMEQVNGIVQSYVTPQQEGCSGNCGGCSGCH